jgi:hypothetical protein
VLRANRTGPQTRWQASTHPPPTPTPPTITPVDGCHEAVAHLEADHVELKLHLVLSQALNHGGQRDGDHVAALGGG